MIFDEEREKDRERERGKGPRILKVSGGSRRR
jgi:hypothetical protein